MVRVACNLKTVKNLEKVKAQDLDKIWSREQLQNEQN